MSRRRIRLGIAANAFDRVAIAGSQLLLVPVLARAWGLHLYGCWVVLASIPSFLALADLGFGNAAYVRMTMLITRGAREAATATLHAAAAMTAFASALVMAAALIVTPLLPAAWLPSDPALPAAACRTVLLLLTGYAIAVVQSGLQLAVFRSTARFALGAFITTNIILLEVALVALAAITGHGPVMAAAGLVAGRFAGVVALQLTLRRTTPWLRFGVERARWAEMRSLTAPALTMLAVPLGQASVLQGSVVALSAAAGPAAAPAFTAARTLSRLGLQFAQMVTYAVMPEFTAAAARADRNAQARLLLFVVTASLAATVPLALVIGAYGQAIVAIWTQGAVTVPPGLMPAMALAVLLGGAWQPLSVLMLAINRQAAFSLAYLLLGAVSAGVTYLLALGTGATGAAWAMVALDAAMCAVVGQFAARHWLGVLPLGATASHLLGRARGTLRRAGGLGGR